MVTLMEGGLVWMSKAMHMWVNNWGLQHSVNCTFMATNFAFCSRYIWEDLKRLEFMSRAAPCWLNNKSNSSSTTDCADYLVSSRLSDLFREMNVRNLTHERDECSELP